MGNSFNISGSNITNLTGSGDIHFQQAPNQTQPEQDAKPESWQSSEGLESDSSLRSADSSAKMTPTEAEKRGEARQIEVFFSYSHRDEELRDELAKHLSILKRQGLIAAWYDRDIGAGTEWATAIDHHLNSAQVILLLISPDFMASDYCFDIEMRRAIERHETGEAIVIPIILRPVDWSGAPFGKLQACPKNAQPVTSWANRDEAFLNVAQFIRKAVEQLR